MQSLRRGVQGVKQIFDRNKERFSLTVAVENEARRDRSGSNFKEWTNPDGTRRITISVHGGAKYGGTWMKDVYLRAIGEIGDSEIMRVQEVIEPDGNVEWNVYLDVTVDSKEGTWPTVADAIYSTRDGGKLYPFHSWSGPVKHGQYREMADDEFENLHQAEMTKNGIRHANELPAYIDVEATVTQFINQIQRKDFSHPVLVSREPSQAEIEQIEENARLRREAYKAKEKEAEAQEVAFNNRREVAAFKSVVKGVESILPSGREKKRGKDFADRFVSIKPQLVQLGCVVYHSGHAEGSDYVTTITLRVDKDNVQAVRTLLHETSINIKKDLMGETARWLAIGLMAKSGLIIDFEKEDRTEVYDIYETKHIADEDASRINLKKNEE